MPDDQEIERLMLDAGVPGLALATIKTGAVEEVSYHGLADIDTKTPVSDTTLFEAASLTKPMLAQMAMLAYDLGKIDIDVPLAETWQDERITDTEYYALLTPRIILSHQTGIDNWASDPRDPETWRAIPIKRRPGEGFNYSGEAYMVLQRFLTAGTEQSFGDFFDAYLAGMMPYTGLDHVPADTVPAYGHDGKGKKGFRSRAMDVSPSPGGAYSALTTAGDYAHFVATVCSGEMFSERTQEIMFTPQVTVEGGAPVSWALGWGVQTSGEEPVYFHWGDNGPYKAFAAFRRDTCDGVVYFANAHGGLKLIEPLAEPVVGDMDAVIDWLDYGRIGDPDTD